MLKPSYAELMEVLNKDTEDSSEITSRYTIVIAASKRARQIIDGDSPMVEDTKGKPLSTAVEEINAGKIKVVPEGQGTVLNLHPVINEEDYLLDEGKYLKESPKSDSDEQKIDGDISEIDNNETFDDEDYIDEDYDEENYNDENYDEDYIDEDYDDDDMSMKEDLEEELFKESDLENKKIECLGASKKDMLFEEEETEEEETEEDETEEEETEEEETEEDETEEEETEEDGQE